MFKRSITILAVFGMFCIANSAMAAMKICSDDNIIGWAQDAGFWGFFISCQNDTSGDWGVNVNLDNNHSPYDKKADAVNAICSKAIAQCNATNGADVKSCLIARDNHCGYNPCSHEWKPHCDSSNNCINAYTYCSGYLSGDCGMALMNCYYGDPSKCQFLYSTCRLRSCEETWDPFCDAYNNCYISYKYCNHLSSDCASAMFWCYYTNMKDKNACDFIFGQCGVPEPR